MLSMRESRTSSSWSRRIRRATTKLAPDELDDFSVEKRGRFNDLTGVKDPDFLALGLGATNMMSMLWSIAKGKRVVGVELRGDPSLGVHWNIREDFYHHLGYIDRLMVERYGEDRLPHRGDGTLLRLGECFYHPDTLPGAVDPDEVISGFLSSLGQ